MACESNATRRPVVRRVWPWMVIVLGMMPLASIGETISVVGPEGGEVDAGGPLSALILLSDSTEALVGYSVAVRVVPLEGSTGTITRDIEASNFAMARNLIGQSEVSASLHPTFSFVGPAADGGIFFNAVTQSLMTVPAAASGLSDALAEAWFNVSGDATGQFRIELISPTALAGEGFEPIGFDTVATTVTVVPEPATILLAGCGIISLLRHRRKQA